MPSNLFSNPQVVTISGYTGTAMQDPQLSPDGSTLFFDSHHDALDSTECFLYYAARANPVLFSFQGTVAPQADVNPAGSSQFTGSLDAYGKFFFFQKHALETWGNGIIKATYSSGSVSNGAPLSGLTPLPVISGAAQSYLSNPFIGAGGNRLFLTNWFVNSAGHPVGAKCVLATKNADGSFTVQASNPIFDAVNAVSQMVYNAAPCGNLYVVFTAVTAYGPQIFVATASAMGEPFLAPDILSLGAPSGNFELENGAPTVDSSGLYYHQILSPTSSRILYAPKT